MLEEPTISYLTIFQNCTFVIKMCTNILYVSCRRRHFGGCAPGGFCLVWFYGVEGTPRWVGASGLHGTGERPGDLELVCNEAVQSRGRGPRIHKKNWYFFQRNYDTKKDTSSSFTSGHEDAGKREGGEINHKHRQHHCSTFYYLVYEYSYAQQ